jgi:hypothetical protein
MTRRARPWLLPLALAPLLAAGLWLWGEQGAMVWLAGFVSYCF